MFDTQGLRRGPGGRQTSSREARSDHVVMDDRFVRGRGESAAKKFPATTERTALKTLEIG